MNMSWMCCGEFGSRTEFLNVYVRHACARRRPRPGTWSDHETRWPRVDPLRGRCLEMQAIVENKERCRVAQRSGSIAHDLHGA
jgi:hypothetical protein